MAPKMLPQVPKRPGSAPMRKVPGRDNKVAEAKARPAPPAIPKAKAKERPGSARRPGSASRVGKMPGTTQPNVRNPAISTPVDASQDRLTTTLQGGTSAQSVRRHRQEAVPNVVSGVEVIGNHSLSLAVLTAIVRLPFVAGHSRLQLQALPSNLPEIRHESLKQPTAQRPATKHLTNVATSSAMPSTQMSGRATASTPQMSLAVGQWEDDVMDVPVFIALPEGGRRRIPSLLRVGPKDLLEEEAVKAKDSRQAYGDWAPDTDEMELVQADDDEYVLHLPLAGGRCMLPFFAKGEALEAISSFRYVFQAALAMSRPDLDEVQPGAVNDALRATQHVCCCILRLPYQETDVEVLSTNLSEVFSSVEDIVLGKVQPEIGGDFYDGVGFGDIVETRGGLASDGVALSELNKIVSDLAQIPKMKPSQWFALFSTQMQQSGSRWKLKAAYSKRYAPIEFESVMQDGDGRAWLSGCSLDQAMQFPLLDAPMSEGEQRPHQLRHRHVFTQPAKWLLSGLLLYAPVDTSSDMKHIRELLMTLACVPESDVTSRSLPGPLEGASAQARFLWAFARRVICSLPFYLNMNVTDGVASLDRPGLQLLWALLDSSVELVASPHTRHHPERKRLALWAALCFSVRLSAVAEKMTEPPWMTERLKRWQTDDGDIDNEGVAAAAHVARLCTKEAWEKTSESKDPRSVLQDKLPWELLEESRPPEGDPHRVDAKAKRLRVEHTDNVQSLAAEDESNPAVDNLEEAQSQEAESQKHGSEESSLKVDTQNPGRFLRTELEKRRRLMVTGGPGAGKRSLCRSVLADFASVQPDGECCQRLPLRISISELKAHLQNGSGDAIQEHIAASCHPDLAAAYTWERLKPPAWPGRCRHQVVQLPSGRILVVAGLSTGASGGKALQDIWASDDSGLTWQELPTPPWPARSGHKVVIWEEKLVLIGGADDEERRLRDAWESPDGGETWLEFPSARWPGRSGHQVLVARLSVKGAPARPHMVLLGGIGQGNKPLKDAWVSDSGGFSWSELEAPPFLPRWDFQVLPFGKKFLISGGCDASGALSDTWVMSGSAWPGKAQGAIQNRALPLRKRTSTLTLSQDDAQDAVCCENFQQQPWAARSHHQVMSYRGQLCLFGGMDAKGEVLRDAWLSQDGQAWSPLPYHTWAAASARAGAEVLEIEDGRLLVLGGMGGGRDLLCSRLLVLALDGVNDDLVNDEGLVSYLDRLFRSETGHLVIATGSLTCEKVEASGDQEANSESSSELQSSTELFSRWDFRECRALPLEESHVRALCMSWTQGMPAGTYEQVEAEMLRPENQDLARSPLMASMLLNALTSREQRADRRQPEKLSRCELYDFVFQRCFQSHNAAKTLRVEEYASLKEQGLVAACAELAFDALGRSSRSAKAHELAALTTSLGAASEPMDKLVRYAQSGQLLLFETFGEGGITFRFPSMQDYLAADFAWKHLIDGKGLPIWLLQEDAAGNVSEAVKSCAQFFCLQAQGREVLRKELMTELREGLAFLLQTMCKAGHALAIRCLLGVAPTFGRQQLMAMKGHAGSFPTALHLAAGNGHQEAVEALIDLAPDAMALCIAVDAEGHAPLHSAAVNGHEATCRTLLHRSPDGHALMNMVEKSSTALLPLHLAAKNGHVAVVKCFLDFATNPEALCAEANVAGNTALHFAAAGGHAETVTAVLCYGGQQSELSVRAAFLLTAINRYDHTALHLAADRGEQPVAKLLLELAPDKALQSYMLSLSDKLGQTALHLAAEKGHGPVVATLLQMAHEPQRLVDARERITGQTALHMAAEAGHCSAVRALLEAAPESDALALATDRCGRYTALHLAAERGHMSTTRVLLELTSDREKLLMSQERFSGQSALHLAAGAGHSSVCQCMLEFAPNLGTLLALKDRSGGFTSLQLACEKGHAEVVQALLELAPDRSMLLKDTLVKWCGFTALHLAAYRGHEEAVDAVLRLAPDKKALLGLKDQRSRTAAELAVDRGRRGVAALFEKMRQQS